VPGCDDAATLVCERLLGDAAVVGVFVCGCDGKTLSVAGSPDGHVIYSNRPYRFVGCCPGDEPMLFTDQCAQARDAAAE
jgi:hypothetical protein